MVSPKIKSKWPLVRSRVTARKIAKSLQIYTEEEGEAICELEAEINPCLRTVTAIEFFDGAAENWIERRGQDSFEQYFESDFTAMYSTDELIDLMLRWKGEINETIVEAREMCKSCTDHICKQKEGA